MHLFYTPDIHSPHYVLNEEESKHCIRVLRLRVGNKIELIDGKGGKYKAEIVDDHQKRCAVKIVETQHVGKRSWHLHVAIAPTKNMDRFEWFIEKATEIGIDEVSPLNCDKSERIIIKNERLNKVAVSAIKQSQKAYLPQINELVDFKEFILAVSDYAGQKFIAHCSEGYRQHIKDGYQIRNNVLILIGPEGDFSSGEIKLAIDNGFKEINLGTSRLRTETAALYACAAVNILNE